MEPLSIPDALALLEASVRLGVTPRALATLIMFESGWDPAARNRSSNARGLIQFMPKTARAMGYASADALVEEHPTRAEQLRGPVVQYLEPLAPFRPGLHDLALSVFYPAARRWDPGKAFPANVRNQNSGIATPRDYVDFVARRAQSTDQFLMPMYLAVAAGGALLWGVIRR